jgi:hypothetical protein
LKDVGDSSKPDFTEFKSELENFASHIVFKGKEFKDFLLINFIAINNAIC